MTDPVSNLSDLPKLNWGQWVGKGKSHSQETVNNDAFWTNQTAQITLLSLCQCSNVFRKALRPLYDQLVWLPKRCITLKTSSIPGKGTNSSAFVWLNGWFMGGSFYLACLCSQCFWKYVYYYHHGFFKWSDSFDKLNQRQPDWKLQVVHVQQFHIQNQRRLTSHRYGEMFPLKEQGVQLDSLNACFGII